LPIDACNHTAPCQIRTVNKLLIVVLAAGCWSNPAPRSAPVSNKAPPRVDGPPPKDTKNAQVVIEEVLQASPGTTGRLGGRVTDSNDEALPGTTVVATSSALVGEQTAITDEKGYFAFEKLPPGHYTVTFYYAEATFEHAVRVADQRLTRLNIEKWKFAPWADALVK
jgi:hypothetical protein